MAYDATDDASDSDDAKICRAYHIKRMPQPQLTLC
jgi:hypothetical protein